MQRDYLPIAPEAVGMSSERLARVTETMRSMVDNGQCVPTPPPAPPRR